jgi:hypothetical protein
VDLFLRCAKKIDRAIEHLQTLDAAGQRFADKHGKPGIRCVVEPNNQGTRCCVKIVETPTFPEVEWGIIIGDAVHCLRSALDQLVFGLCLEPSKRRSAFPICRTERDWIIDAPGQIWSLPSKYLAIVHGAQPYHRGDQASAHPLALLNELWNLDKHRAIPSTALVPRRIRVEVDEERTYGLSWKRFRTHPGRLLKEGTVIADCGYTLLPGATRAKMYVDPDMSVAVGFGEISGASVLTNKPVNGTFKEIVRTVIGIVRDARDA